MARKRIAAGFAWVGMALGVAWPAMAQAPAASKADGKSFGSLEALRGEYAKRLADLDRQRIADLSALAARAKGEEADAADHELFSLAIARNLYSEAQPAAKRRMADQQGPRELRALATLVVLIDKLNHGKYDESLADLTAYMKARPANLKPEDRIDETTAMALGEAYLQRLIDAGRYDLAKKMGELAKTHHSPAFREHFAARMARIDMIGRMAPALSGKDVDGKIVRLADLKGKVVLIDFWATWCPPCVVAFPELAALNAEYGPKGFVTLGVNLDAQRQDVGSVAKAAPVVRQFLLAHRAAWPNILVGGGGDDPTRAYGVNEIPANFLVGADGKIIRVELTGDALRKAVAEAVGGAKPESGPRPVGGDPSR